MAGKFDPAGFLFGAAVKDRLRELERRGHPKIGMVSAKTLTHLRTTARQKRKGTGATALWGLLHARCPYAWPFAAPGLVLYPATLYPIMAGLKEPGRRDFLARARSALGLAEKL